MITLPLIFSDGMVIQRNKPIKIWGVAESAQELCVALDGAELYHGSIPQGEFSIMLPAQPAGSGHCLALNWPDGSKTMHDISFGEVWIAGGQSNMEFLLSYDSNAQQTIAAANDPLIHYYEVGKYAFDGEREEGLKADAPLWERWLPYTSDNAPNFSAVATYFCTEIRRKLPNIPIGVISCNWGGTSASAWMAEEDLEADRELYEAYLKPYRTNLQTMDLPSYYKKDKQFRIQSQSEGARKSIAKMLRSKPGFFMTLMAHLYASNEPAIPGPRSEQRPAGLYHTMLGTIAGFPCAGVLWYQGENDDTHAELYGKLFSSMIRCWRTLWTDELPFYFVQLPGYEKWLANAATNWPELRRQQTLVAATVPRCYMASIMDVGMRKDIHPKNKRPVGLRLALLALKYEYGQAVEADAPELDGVSVLPDGLHIQFRYADGLHMCGSELVGLEVLVSGTPAVVQVKIDHDSGSLVVTGSGLVSGVPIEVRYAWANWCQVNLFNGAGLPAKPFRWKSEIE